MGYLSVKHFMSFSRPAWWSFFLFKAASLLVQAVACRLAKHLMVLIVAAVPSFSAHALVPSAPQLAAGSYILIDANSGHVIVEQMADAQMPPASLTKIMTAFIVSTELEKSTVSLEDEVPISVKAWKMGGSKMFIREGTNVLLGDLLKGVIIQSGNDASIAIAEFIGGSEDGFAELMNQQAFLLGMNNSYFQNATGWPAEGHFSTARDMSKLAQALILRFPDHYGLYSEKEFTYNDITQPNRNGLLWRDRYVDGIKTGHTDEAGYCLVASAEKDGMRLISVVMNTKSVKAREQETQKLLSYGFRYFETHEIYPAAQVLTEARVWGGEQEQFSLGLAEPLVLTIPRGKKPELEAIMEIDREILAPVVEGQSYGVLKVKLDGELIQRRQLVAQSNIAQSGFISRTIDQIVLAVRGLLGMES